MNAKSFLFSSSLFAVASFLASPAGAMDAPERDRPFSAVARAAAPAPAAAAAAAAPAFSRDDDDKLEFWSLMSLTEEELRNRFFGKIGLYDPSEKMDRLIQTAGPKLVDSLHRDVVAAEFGLRMQSRIDERTAETSKSILDKHFEEMRLEMHRINASDELSQVARGEAVAQSLASLMTQCASEICVERPKIRLRERDKRLEIEGRLASARDEHKKGLELIENLKKVRQMIPQKVAEHDQEMALFLEQYRQKHQKPAVNNGGSDEKGDK